MAGFDGTTTPTITLQLYKSSTWTDVASTDIMSMVLTRGRRTPDLPYQVGTLNVVVNNATGIYDPDYTSASTWVVSGASILKVGLPCRLRATWSATSYDLFYGYLESPKLDQGNNPTVTFTFADGLASIGRAIAPVLTTSGFTTYAGETTTTRVGRMLDYAGWAAGSRSVSGFTVTMNGDKQDRSCLALIRECAWAEGGAFYVSRANVATLEGIGAKFSKVTRVAFSDDATANTIPYKTITTSSGADGLYNDATISRAPSNQYRAKYDASVTANGLRSYTVTAPVSSNTSAANLSYLYARQWADAVVRITELTFDGMRLSTLYPDLCALELGELTWVKRHTKDGRTITYNLVVEGYTYTFTKAGWAAKFYTSPVNSYTITV